MPSYTASLRFTLQDTGSNLNVWGNILNSGVFALVDTAIAGRYSTTSAAVALTFNQGSTDTSRNAILDVTGGTGTTFTAPAVSKTYFVRNASSGDTVITTGGATNATVKAGEQIPVFGDGTNFYRLRLLDMAGDRLSNLATPTAVNDAATKAYVDGIAFQTTGALPGQNPGTAYNAVFSDGANAAWRRAQPISSAATLGKALKSAGADGFPDTASVWDWDGYQGSQLKTGAYTVVQNDRNTLIRCTGSPTIALDALATLGTEFDVLIGNFGTGLVTIDPSGTETLTFPGQAAQTSCVLVPGEVVRFMGDTTTWRAILAQGLGSGPHYYAYESTTAVITYIQSTWTTRLIDTLVGSNPLGLTLASATITGVPPGRYRVECRAGGRGVGGLNCRLRNTGTSTDVSYGFNGSADDLGSGYLIFGSVSSDEQITVTATSNFVLQTVGNGSSGTWGIPGGTSPQPAKGAEVRFTRIGP